MQIFNKHNVFKLLLLLGCGLSAQEYNTKIEGRVYSNAGDVAAIHVSNTASKRGTITDIDGFFTIAAQLNDTLVFSAVQFKKEEVIVTIAVLEHDNLEVYLEESLTQLNEVVVMPYNLTGDINRDMSSLETGRIITASTEKLPNATIRVATQSERNLFTATDLDCNCTGSKLDPLFNYISGRTKMIKRRIARDAQEDITTNVRKFYADSFYIKSLKIPKNKIDDFVYFSERDSSFNTVASAKDKLKLWELLQRKSLEYRKINKLD